MVINDLTPEHPCEIPDQHSPHSSSMSTPPPSWPQRQSFHLFLVVMDPKEHSPSVVDIQQYCYSLGVGSEFSTLGLFIIFKATSIPSWLHRAPSLDVFSTPASSNFLCNQWRACTMNPKNHWLSEIHRPSCEQAGGM